MDPKCPFRGDKDDGDTEISCYEDHNYIKKIDGYQEAISKAFTYNESYLCIHKPLSKEKENVSKGFLLNENHISSEILNKVYSLAGETNYVSNLASFFSNNRWLNIKGKVQVTNYRVIFVPDDFDFLERISIRKDYFHFPMTFIEEIIFLNKKEWDFPVEFKFLMKDSRTFSLKIQPKPNFDFLKTYDYMISRSKIEDFRSFFAFSYHEYCKKGSDNHWELYDIKSEMKRQGIYDKITTGPNEKPLSLWNLIDNSDYSVCNTYPAFFVIPAKISKTQMMKCAEFRTKNRLPALVYVLKKHDPLTKKNKFVTLWRSSQIMMGIRGSRCIEDENFIKLIGDPSSEIIDKEINDSNIKANLHIFDARCYSAALGNQLIGGGTESNASYRNSEVFFKNIENIHMVRDSYKKVSGLCNNNYNNVKWLSLLEETKWLEYLSSLLTASKDIIDAFSKGISVLVHCSDGWDRTTQIVSLTQIMIDPHFRTIKGFQNLIDKDWISFGHKIRLRNGIGSSSDDKAQNSPIFLQFLDCVHQILKQFPSAFEFNLKYLSEIAKHSYSTIFGNFLCNSEKEFNENEIRRKTKSLWNYLQPEVFKNYFYEKADGYYLIPDTTMSCMKLWEEWFMYPSKILKKTCAKNTAEFFEDYYHCYYMNKKNQKVDSDYEIIDGKDIN